MMTDCLRKSGSSDGKARTDISGVSGRSMTCERAGFSALKQHHAGVSSSSGGWTKTWGI